VNPIAAFQDVIDGIQDLVVGAADEWWVLALLYAFCTIDGFFPPIPSESIVIALAALAVHAQTVPLWLIFLIAAAGALTGDLIAFGIGRRIPVRTARLFRSERGQAMLDWAETRLARSGGSFILSARYVPVGRVAVNMTAGAVGFPLRRFLLFDALASLLWAGFGIVIGTVAGRLLGDRPLVSMGVGILVGIVLGWVIDRVLARLGLGGAELERPAARGDDSRDGEPGARPDAVPEPVDGGEEARG